MSANFNIPMSSWVTPYIGVSNMHYVSSKDIRRAMAFGSDNEFRCQCDEIDARRFWFSYDGDYIEARQGLMLVPANQVAAILYETALLDPESVHETAVGSLRWCLVISLCPPGKPSMVKLIYPLANMRDMVMVALKMSKTASCLWRAYYAREDVRRQLAGEIMVGSEQLCTRYDPLEAARGTMPQPMAEVRNRRIDQFSSMIDRELARKSKYMVNPDGDIVLYLWWLPEYTGET